MFQIGFFLVEFCSFYWHNFLYNLVTFINFKRKMLLQVIHSKSCEFFELFPQSIKSSFSTMIFLLEASNIAKIHETRWWSNLTLSSLTKYNDSWWSVLGWGYWWSDFFPTLPNSFSIISLIIPWKFHVVIGFQVNVMHTYGV
jgi:hypothetical protein